MKCTNFLTAAEQWVAHKQCKQACCQFKWLTLLNVNACGKVGSFLSHCFPRPCQRVVAVLHSCSEDSSNLYYFERNTIWGKKQVLKTRTNEHNVVSFLAIVPTFFTNTQTSLTEIHLLWLNLKQTDFVRESTMLLSCCSAKRNSWGTIVEICIQHTLKSKASDLVFCLFTSEKLQIVTNFTLNRDEIYQVFKMGISWPFSLSCPRQSYEYWRIQEFWSKNRLSTIRREMQFFAF